MENPFVKWLLGLWDNSNFGASMRKALAVWIMILITRIHNKYLAFEMSDKGSGSTDFLEMLIYVDYIAIGLLLGLILWQDLAKFRISNKDEPKDEKKDS